MNSSTALGVDIGGSHITAARVQLNLRAVIPESLTRAKLDPHGTAEEIIHAWSAAIRQAQGNDPIGRIGIAMPGPFEYEAGISLIRNQDKYDALYGLNIKDLLAAALGITPEAICLKNDAACFLQGEAFAGAGSGLEHCAGITLGTGLGGALYRNGHAENWDLWNLAFKEAIAEDYLSTRWFVTRYFDLTGRKVHGVKELVALFGDDPAARQVFAEFAVNLEQLLDYLIAAEAPRGIVIGGNIAHAYTLFEAAMNKIQARHPSVTISKAGLGETAAIIGAASLWMKELQEKPI